ncbi:histidine phosphatase family protein [Kibdelosporangium philippinense]|uniref:Histidine phosphatase family protein n=1 Tax=Kibdelosporangium philippinense TaxID=211113 RepID=A0ABS8ZJ67_9PSEU|nr:histidine phosphatase family protein [Kibdelosporangium philippinense]MCE7006513.1 histidine phosphatase family protein [Kibdelosporangium philippinense]
MTIYLARHGQTAYNQTRRFQGQMDVPLDETGHQQAKQLAIKVADLGIVALWASPLARARQTAEAVSAHLGLPIQFDARLMETDTGIWTDKMYDDLAAADPYAYEGWVTARPDFGFEGGETYVQQTERVMAALTEIEQGPGPALVISHGMSMRLALTRRGGDTWLAKEAIPNTAVIELPNAGPATDG